MRFKITYCSDNVVVVEDTFKPFRKAKVIRKSDVEIKNAILEYYEQDYVDMKKVLGEEIDESEMIIYAVKQFEIYIKNEDLRGD